MRWFKKVLNKLFPRTKRVKVQFVKIFDELNRKDGYDTSSRHNKR